jgi:hypothetical protein
LRGFAESDELVFRHSRVGSGATASTASTLYTQSTQKHSGRHGSNLFP